MQLYQSRNYSRTIAQVLETSSTSDRKAPSIVNVAGTVRTVRKQKRISFAAIGDGSTIQPLQIVLEPVQAQGLSTGTTVEVTGEWRLSPAGKEQSHELKAQSVKIVGSVEAETYPLQKKYHTPEYLRTIPHLRLRTPFNALITRLRSETEFWLHSFFRGQDFVKVQPPLITSSDCEGAGEVFTLSANSAQSTRSSVSTALPATQEYFFRTPRFLTVSSQLHLETFIPEHQRVWSLSPTFRAEKSDTPRHLSEFSMLEVEMRTENLSAVMDLVENMIRTLVRSLQQSRVGSELLRTKGTEEIANPEENGVTDSTMRRRWEGLVGQPWPRITYSQALKQLQAAASNGGRGSQSAPLRDRGLQLEHEKSIVDHFGQGGPVFVTDYPQEIKPFYMLPSEPSLDDGLSSGPTAACFDLLMPEICEVVGGSLREHRLPQLVEAMRQHGIRKPRDASGFADRALDSQGFPSPKGSMSSLDWYIDLRRYGSVPHGGFGLGVDRLLGYLAGVPNIRDVVPYPRYYGRCDC
ncbi:MAG: asparaginyl-tRNA synthetase [Pleopsidium flavum]|nr:MAG: asparaginyl-tRNA synthetase [Pleopsidium flavum]